MVPDFVIWTILSPVPSADELAKHGCMEGSGGGAVATARGAAVSRNSNSISSVPTQPFEIHLISEFAVVLQLP